MININNPQWNQFLAELAKQLNIGLDVVKTNSHEYLLLFAKYKLLNNIGCDILFGAMFGLFVWFAIFVICKLGLELNDVPYKKIVFICVIISIFCFILHSVMLYNIPPEMYGINNLLRITTRQ